MVSASQNFRTTEECAKNLELLISTGVWTSLISVPSYTYPWRTKVCNDTFLLLFFQEGNKMQDLSTHRLCRFSHVSKCISSLYDSKPIPNRHQQKKSTFTKTMSDQAKGCQNRNLLRSVNYNLLKWNYFAKTSLKIIYNISWKSTWLLKESLNFFPCFHSSLLQGLWGVSPS